ncbi:hypothetical protein CSUI_008634 [Cystoisospora suis]|uniref:Uncharacterized protein n=1 Tax=Cystoisospora suis TaxID=483139 RepID=A0A2C6KLQ1_9APIC|nr:hypothetical protein CSUI_008634 [Cystoisospora suis]
MAEVEMMGEAPVVVQDLCMSETGKGETSGKETGEENVVRKETHPVEEKSAKNHIQCRQSSRTSKERNTPKSGPKAKTFQASLRCMYLLIFIEATTHKSFTSPSTQLSSQSVWNSLRLSLEEAVGRMGVQILSSVVKVLTTRPEEHLAILKADCESTPMVLLALQRIKEIAAVPCRCSMIRACPVLSGLIVPRRVNANLVFL